MRDLEHLTEDNDISKEKLAGEEAHPGEVQDLKDEDTPRQEDLQHLETEDMLGRRKHFAFILLSLVILARY